MKMINEDMSIDNRAMKYKKFESKCLKQMGLNWTLSISAKAILFVHDMGLGNQKLKFHFDHSKSLITFLDYQPTGHKIMVAYI